MSNRKPKDMSWEEWGRQQQQQNFTQQPGGYDNWEAYVDARVAQAAPETGETRASLFEYRQAAAQEQEPTSRQQDSAEREESVFQKYEGRTQATAREQQHSQERDALESDPAPANDQQAAPEAQASVFQKYEGRAAQAEQEQDQAQEQAQQPGPEQDEPER